MFRRYSLSDFMRWLRQRSVMRRHAGDTVPDDPAFRDEAGNPLAYEPNKYTGCLLWFFLLLLIIIALFIFTVCEPFGGDDEGLIGSPTLAPTTGPPTTGATTTTTTMQQSLPTPLDTAYRALSLDPTVKRARIIQDLINDLIDSESSREPGRTGGGLDIVQMIIRAAGADGLTVRKTFNESIYECGDTDPVVVCTAGVEPMPEGDILVVAVEHDAPIPIASTDSSYIYSLVFDSDLDPANDWQFNPPFDWDYFQGADRWYQATYNHDTGIWTLVVNQVSEGNQISDPLASAVRVVIEDEWVIWFVPSSEIPAFPGLVRATSFEHDGFFTPGDRGGDVTGADPTEPLSDPSP